MSALEDDYLTVAEAASLLGVAPSTIRRRIHAGEIRAERFGFRWFVVSRPDGGEPREPIDLGTDTEKLVTPHQEYATIMNTPETKMDQRETLELLDRIKEMYPVDIEPDDIPVPTPAAKLRALEAIDRIDRLRNELLARRNGELFSPSWEIINEMRDERTRQLMGE